MQAVPVEGVSIGQVGNRSTLAHLNHLPVGSAAQDTTSLQVSSSMNKRMLLIRLCLLTVLGIQHWHYTYGHLSLECSLSKLDQYVQTIQLADSGDGFTEMVPPKPETQHIWPREMAVLHYEYSRPTIPNKVWLFKTLGGKSFRLDKKIEDFPCFDLGEAEQRDPYEHSFYLRTSLDGMYTFAEYDTNWKLLKNLETHKGKNEIYTPLKTFVVLELEPAKIGLMLRMSFYEPFPNCTGSDERISWVMGSLKDLRSASSMRIDRHLLDGEIKHKVIRTQCQELSNESSPVYISTYYNIDRARITPSGSPLEQERPWAIKAELGVGLESDDRVIIPLPDPFGSVTRIRLSGIQVEDKDEIKLILKTRSEEGMTEIFWGPGNTEIPFPAEYITPYVFADVRLNRTIFHKICARNAPVLDWMLIEPMYGRIRTSTGVMIAMNVRDSWTNAQFLTELIIEKRGSGRRGMRIDRVTLEQPQHPEDVNEMLRAVHEEHPLPGATPLISRACLTKVHGYATSSYYVNLEDPAYCIRQDRKLNQVYKKTRSIRSALTGYSVQLLYDDFGDELVNSTGVVTGHIQMVAFSRHSRTVSDPEMDCPKQTTQDGETMRMGFLVDRVKDRVQFLARWEDRWVQYLGNTNDVSYVPVREKERWASTPRVCPPERTEVDFVYDLNTRSLRVATNDTNELVLNTTLKRHPIWLGIELFVDENSSQCIGCFLHVQIDRRAIRHNRPSQWPVVDTAVNNWHQIHYPRQANSKALYNAWVEVSQTCQRRVALTPSPKNLQRRILDLTRKLANPVGVSVAMVGAGAYCPPGQYMPYGTPAVCVGCPPGTQSRLLTENTSFPVYVCQQCPRGTYQDTPGQTECNPCPKGQSTHNRGSWSSGSCGPNVTTDGVFVANTRGIPIRGEPYIMVELPASSKEQTYDWTKDKEDTEYQGIEGPGELNMVGTGRLVFNMVSLVILLGCVMAFVVTSKGYMLISITLKTRYGERGLADTSSKSNEPQSLAELARKFSGEAATKSKTARVIPPLASDSAQTESSDQ
ncbi:hypothetical protein CLF_107493 [Clonorchis sinensis]|uniref:Tyrosine-protein kinase ephrin type A/B receptor-like domain-containing protein n=1 Tax=Clonorchis sinensis TaxID=79923 RepID=G7YGW1_CLOSI|nr:hypothetical protein CLF_107493 [Clonorchis sinensis]